MIEADPDGPGRDAALKLDAALGGRAEISWNQGGDPADVWTEPWASGRPSWNLTADCPAMNPNSGRGRSQSKGGERMSTDRLGKLLKAWRLAVENEGNDGGGNEPSMKGKSEVLIGGGEAAPTPGPIRCGKPAKPRPGRGVAVVGGCLALARGALFRRMAR